MGNIEVTRRSSRPAPASPAEVVDIHTGILRLALAVDESRAYWEHAEPGQPVVGRSTTAFEQRWFGSKSMERVKYLLATFGGRYDAFPSALAALHRWSSMDIATRQVVCHWHMQLADPIYRRFTGEYLNQRRSLAEPRIDRDAVLRWVKAEHPDKWSDATCVQFASKLLSAALEAGLVSKRDPRTLPFPKVPDLALAYLLYLLRETRFEGTLTANPYLASVGLDEDTLASKARGLPGVSMRRMMGLVDFEWSYPDLFAWAQEVVS